MLKLIGAEFFKLRKRWMPYFLLLVLLAIGAPPVLVNYITITTLFGQLNDGGGIQVLLVLPDAMENVFNAVPGLGMFLTVFLSASVIGTEYGGGTLRQTLAKGVSRNNYLRPS
jgi:hypothetical protein